MDTFKIDEKEHKISSINRTIRIKSTHFEQLMELSEKTGVSFNKIVSQCLEFALSRLEHKD
ncbi:MAG: hypothetical protein LBB42_05485 [Coriobacteriales bacterium]|nr:hypothetical protein [Coriobacteriales bacterium]